MSRDWQAAVISGKMFTPDCRGVDNQGVVPFAPSAMRLHYLGKGLNLHESFAAQRCI